MGCWDAARLHSTVLQFYSSKFWSSPCSLWLSQQLCPSSWGSTAVLVLWIWCVPSLVDFGSVWVCSWGILVGCVFTGWIFWVESWSISTAALRWWVWCIYCFAIAFGRVCLWLVSSFRWEIGGRTRSHCSSPIRCSATNGLRIERRSDVWSPREYLMLSWGLCAAHCTSAKA